MILGKNEKIIREERNASYHGGHSRHGHIMYGNLLLTNKRFLFEEIKWKNIGFFSTNRVEESGGIKINLPLEGVIGSKTETRVRKKGTLKNPPTLFSKEDYKVLIVSLETSSGLIENPIFGVMNANDWAIAIQRTTEGELV